MIKTLFTLRWAQGRARRLAAASLTILVGAALAGTAAAQTSVGVSATATAPGRVVPPLFRDQLEKLRQERQEIFQSSTTTDERRERLEELREKFQNTMEERRDAMEKQIELHRAELKKRLEAIKDRWKAEITDRVDLQLKNLNERLTNHFVQVLDKLDDVLARIEDRMKRAESNGRDVSSVKTAITAAQGAIASARAAVTAQAGKTYGVQVTTEANLRVDVKSARDALRADLRTVQDAVKAARDAVHDAAVALGRVGGLGAGATTTVSSTNP